VSARKPRVLLLRGQNVNPWDLRPWEHLADRFDVSCVVTGSNLYDVETIVLQKVRLHALSDVVPSKRGRALAAMAPFNRYLGLEQHLERADIVHGAELSPWPTVQAAKQKSRLGYRLVLTVWETIPFGSALRHALARGNRRRALEAADLFLAATERARSSLLLEGALDERISVSPPGVDLERFGAVRNVSSGEHVVVSPARLVWEKGHQDVLRAVAALRRGIVPTPSVPRLLIVGAGTERERLRSYADDLGIGDLVEVREHVPYEEMPNVYAGASCVVLASLSTPRWEEQFGIVLAEAMAAGVPIVASESGAIPEVAGDGATYFPPGDWLGLARRLAAGPLARPSGDRVTYDETRVERYSSIAAAARLAAAYDRVLDGRST
jgi:glycosyltransferase involved in cell wall biosynthesis